jgi:hypothetical protein
MSFFSIFYREEIYIKKKKEKSGGQLLKTFHHSQGYENETTQNMEKKHGGTKQQVGPQTRFFYARHQMKCEITKLKKPYTGFPVQRIYSF